MRIGACFFVALSACGKSASPPPPEKVEPPPPPATPEGVVGCWDSYVAIPNEAHTDFVIVYVDHAKYGTPVRLPIDGSVHGVNVTLEVLDRPNDGERYCTDWGTSTRRIERYVGVAGRLEISRKGDLVSAKVDDARFVDGRGRIIDIAHRECANVKVGWMP